MALQGRPGRPPDKDNQAQSAKRLGEYTTKAKAEAAIECRSGEEGFRNWPHGFRIEVVPLDVGFPPDPDGPLVRTYDLWHFRIGRDDEDDIDDPVQTPTKIGVFSSQRNVKAAIERFKHDPRFRDFPDGFRTYGVRPDTDFGVEEFIGWNEWR